MTDRYKCGSGVTTSERESLFETGEFISLKEQRTSLFVPFSLMEKVYFALVLIGSTQELVGMCQVFSSHTNIVY